MTPIQRLLQAVEMDLHNEAIRHGAKGKAWDGNFVARELRTAWAAYHAHGRLPAPTNEEATRLSAARWDALMKCSRVRVIGYARGGARGDEGPIRHIGFEFTSNFTDNAYAEQERQLSVPTLIEFVDGLLTDEAKT